MHFKKLLSFISSAILVLTPISTIAACSSPYSELQTKLSSKETFIGYLGIKNCDFCALLQRQWDTWMDEENWDEDIFNQATTQDANLKINRYTFVADFDQKGQTNGNWQDTFSKTRWVKNIYKYIKDEQKKLWDSNQDIQNIVDSTYLPDGAIPILFFVKHGEFRWFTKGWNKPTVGGNDMRKTVDAFKNNSAYNTSTLKRLVRDYIIHDFSQFYQWS